MAPPPRDVTWIYISEAASRGQQSTLFSGGRRVDQATTSPCNADHIRHRDGDAVLLSRDEFDNLLETLALLSSRGFREGFETARQDLEAGATLSFEEVFGEAQ